uniref:Uncharacterized protein n=1 Tax=Setaria italica TaxID=4555 RepID=K3Z1S0_SETIT
MLGSAQTTTVKNDHFEEYKHDPIFVLSVNMLRISRV